MASVSFDFTSNLSSFDPKWIEPQDENIFITDLEIFLKSSDQDFNEKYQKSFFHSEPFKNTGIPFYTPNRSNSDDSYSISQKINHKSSKSKRHITNFYEAPNLTRDKSVESRIWRRFFPVENDFLFPYKGIKKISKSDALDTKPKKKDILPHKIT
jgi:hypothetical protein